MQYLTSLHIALPGFNIIIQVSQWDVSLSVAILSHWMSAMYHSSAQHTQGDSSQSKRYLIPLLANCASLLSQSHKRLSSCLWNSFLLLLLLLLLPHFFIFFAFFFFFFFHSSSSSSSSSSTVSSSHIYWATVYLTNLFLYRFNWLIGTSCHCTLLHPMQSFCFVILYFITLNFASTYFSQLFLIIANSQGQSAGCVGGWIPREIILGKASEKR